MRTPLPEGIRQLGNHQLDAGFLRFYDEARRIEADPQQGRDSLAFRALFADVPWVTEHPYRGEHVGSHCMRGHSGRQEIVGPENVNGQACMRRRCVVPDCRSTWLEPMP